MKPRSCWARLRPVTRRLVLSAALALLCAGVATAGFPTFDAAAFGQRLTELINSNQQVAAMVSLVQNTLTMITKMEDQLDHHLSVAEGRLGALAGWNQTFPALSGLGSATELADWRQRVSRTLQRAQRLGTSATDLPSEADIRAAWAQRPTDAALGTPVVPAPALTRADVAAAARTEAQSQSTALGEFFRARAEAHQRLAGKLEETVGKLQGITVDTEVTSVAVGQKQLSTLASQADLEASGLQIELWREELEIQRQAKALEALQSFHETMLEGTRATWRAHTRLMGVYDAAAADAAVADGPRLPVY